MIAAHLRDRARPREDQYTVLRPLSNHHHKIYNLLQYRERQTTICNCNSCHWIKKKMCLRCMASWKSGRKPFSVTFCMGPHTREPLKTASQLIAHPACSPSSPESLGSNFTFSTCCAKELFFWTKSRFLVTR